MAKKFSPARREAFFRALGETGNQTIAAERARVSRSWVCLHRAEDPDFRAKMDAAIAEAKVRLREGGGMTPAAGWRSLGGEELVVRGSNGRRVQIARARLKQWTPRVEARFLATLAATCNVKASCAAVGLSAASAYAHARRAPGFIERWRAAVEEGYFRIEAELLGRTQELLARPAQEDRQDAPEPAPLTVDQAFQLLHMHKHKVHGIGERVGRRPRKDGLPDALRVLLRNMDRIERRNRRAAEREAGRQRSEARDRPDAAVNGH